MSRSARRIAIWPDVAAAVYALAFVVWLAIPGQSRETRELLDTAFYLPCLAVAWASARTSGLWPHDRATARAWALIASAQALYWLTGIIWSSLQIYAPTLVATPASELLALGTYPLLIAGLLHFPGVHRDTASRWRRGLDLALIVLGCALGSWYFSYLPASAQQVSVVGALASRLLYPTAELAVIAVTARAMLGAARPTTRRSLAWLLTARGARVAAAVTYSQLATGRGYAPGHWVNGLWFATWGFGWIAARAAQHRIASGATAREREQAGTYSSGGLPVLSLLLAQGLLLWLLRAELSNPPGVIAIGTTVLTGLLALRHMAELRENRLLRAAEREQDARFRSLVQRGSDVVLVAGARGSLLYASPSAARLAAGPLPAAGPSSLQDLFDAEAAAALDQLIERCARGEAGPPLPVRARGPRGEAVHLEFLAADLRAEPAVGGVVLTGRDVTERQMLAGELRRTEKLRAVGQAAGRIAHDLNNLLFILGANTELLLEQLPGPGSARDDVVQIGRAVERGAAVTRKLLQFSRRDGTQPATLDLNAVARELEPVLRQLISSGIEVRIDYSSAPAWVLIDRPQLEQVVLDLAMNARDAMPDGGRLELRIGAAGPSVTLSIRDSGRGMDAVTRSRIFEPFFTTKPQSEGSGLGLASAYGIVTSVAGELDVQSEEGRGTTFTIVLPRAAAPLDPAS